ncbi:MAG: hypothetical protein AAF713_00945 [Pseudomonadota bacterium]
MTAIVDRHPDRIELYFATRADNFVSAFGLLPEQLTGSSGTVNFAELRNGTFDIGDAMFSSVQPSLDGDPLAFEAMSLMVHPTEDAPQVQTPLEAFIAMGVCAVDAPSQAPLLSDLQGYAGYIAYAEDPYGALTLSLPETGREDLKLTVLDFRKGEPVASHQISVADGGEIDIAPLPGGFAYGHLLGLFLVLLAAGGGTIPLLRRKQDHS